MKQQLLPTAATAVGIATATARTAAGPAAATLAAAAAADVRETETSCLLLNLLKPREMFSTARCCESGTASTGILPRVSEATSVLTRTALGFCRQGCRLGCFAAPLSVVGCTRTSF